MRKLQHESEQSLRKVVLLCPKQAGGKPAREKRWGNFVMPVRARCTTPLKLSLNLQSRMVLTELSSGLRNEGGTDANSTDFWVGKTWTARQVCVHTALCLRAHSFCRLFHNLHAETNWC